MHVKKGDTVTILAGKDKGKKGKIVRVLPKKNKVIIEGVNMAQKHQRPRRSSEKGTVLKVAMPLHASNVKKAQK